MSCARSPSVMRANWIRVKGCSSWPTCMAPRHAISACRSARWAFACAVSPALTCRCCCAYSITRKNHWTNWQRLPPAVAAGGFSSIMLEKDIVISNKLGLHARASAKLVQLVQGFKSTVWLVSKGREVNAQSIMGVMMLAAGLGTPLTIRADGTDEQNALEAVVALFDRKFDEGA